MSYKGRFQFDVSRNTGQDIFAAYHQPSRPITNKSIEFSTIDGCQENRCKISRCSKCNRIV
jgi:hypothetical protein